jgi:hypothetical protein
MDNIQSNNVYSFKQHRQTQLDSEYLTISINTRSAMKNVLWFPGFYPEDVDSMFLENVGTRLQFITEDHNMTPLTCA